MQNRSSVRNRLFLVFVLCVASSCLFGQGTRVTTAQKALFDEAVTQFQKKDFQGAIATISKLITANPGVAEAYYIRGQCNLFQGNFAESIPDLTMTIKLASNTRGIEEVYNNRGAAYQAIGNDTNAILDFDKAISLNPNHAAPYNGRGVLLDKQGQTDKALSDFNKAIELDPKGAAAYVGRGYIRFARNDLAGALADFQKVIDFDPNVAAAFLIRGTIRGLQGRWEVSVDDLRTSFDMDRRNRGPLSGLISTAFPDIDRYVCNYPKNANARAVRGFVNLLRKQDSDAEADFAEAFKLEPKLKDELAELIESVRFRR
jgi:tetratricopeptide (TPR) repeat protein